MIIEGHNADVLINQVRTMRKLLVDYEIEASKQGFKNDRFHELMLQELANADYCIMALTGSPN